MEIHWSKGVVTRLFYSCALSQHVIFFSFIYFLLCCWTIIKENLSLSYCSSPVFVTMSIHDTAVLCAAIMQQISVFSVVSLSWFSRCALILKQNQGCYHRRHREGHIDIQINMVFNEPFYNSYIHYSLSYILALDQTTVTTFKKQQQRDALKTKWNQNKIYFINKHQWSYCKSVSKRNVRFH